MRHNAAFLERGVSGTDTTQINQEILEAIPAGAGPRIVTDKGGAFYSVRPPGSQVLLPRHLFAGIMLAPAPKVRATLGSDKVHEYDAQTGNLVLNSAHVDSSLIWSTTRENVVIALKQESLRELAEQELDSGTAEVEPPPFGTIDSEALHIAQLLKAELTGIRTTNELYVDSLITIFAFQVLRNYTSQTKQPRQLMGALSLPAARRVDDYLRENFTRKLSVKELAAIAGLSPRHFIKAFSKTFGAAPHRYLLDLRLDFAERLLVEGHLAIAEVAYLSGFSSQSHLTAAMRKHRRSTPAQLRAPRGSVNQ